MSSGSFSTRLRIPVARPSEREEDGRESVPSPYAEDVHTAAVARASQLNEEVGTGDRPTETKGIKQYGARYEDERQGKTEDAPQEKSERGKMVTRAALHL